MSARRFAAVVAVLLGACSTSPTPRLYAIDPGAVAVAATSGPSVYVAAVSVPEAVDRPQIVLRRGAGEIVVQEQHRWAEPLRLALGRVVAAQLSAALGTAHVGAYPGNALIDATYRIQIEFQRVEATPGDAVTLEAVWSVRRPAGGPTLSGRTLGTAPLAATPDALAQAYVAATQAVSRDIARAVGELASRR